MHTTTTIRKKNRKKKRKKKLAIKQTHALHLHRLSLVLSVVAVVHPAAAAAAEKQNNIDCPSPL
jgi:hypothetical protein